MTPYDRDVVARTAGMEAAGEGIDGIRAVIAAIFNRLKSGAWFSSKTLAGVCLRRDQFSCWNSDQINGALRLRWAELPDDDPELNLCRAAVDDMAAGGDDPTGSATHYYSVRMPQPPSWVEGATFTVQIGHHRFYRDVK